MPNMPATSSAWMTLAADTLRERKIRSGTSGVAARASRATKEASSASVAAPRPSVRAEPHPSSAAGWTSVETPSISAPVTSSAPGTSAPCPKPMPRSASSSRTARTAVAIPIGTLTKKIRCQLSTRSARRRPAGRPSRRRRRRRRRRRSLWPAPALGEHRDDHAEDHRRGHRAADALQEAGGDEQLLAPGQPAQQRRDREDPEAGQEHGPAPEDVAEAPGQQAQAAEGDQSGSPCSLAISPYDRTRPANSSVVFAGATRLRRE
jgi:hypothetical protein